MEYTARTKREMAAIQARLDKTEETMRVYAIANMMDEDFVGSEEFSHFASDFAMCIFLNYIPRPEDDDTIY